MAHSVLGTVPLFSSFSSEEMELLSAIAVAREYRRGQFIIMQGDEGGTFFIILAGKVKVLISSPQGREVTLAVLSAGDFFGEMSLIDGSARSASVVAISGTQALTIEHHAFREFMRKCPDVAIRLLGRFMARLRQADRLIEHLALHPVKGRLIAMLLDWAIAGGTIREDVLVFALPFTHREIAGMLGTSRESVTRMLTELKDSGFLRADRNNITITDLDGLRRCLV